MARRRKRPLLRPHHQGQLMENISIASIIVEGRFRKDMGDIEGLASSIKALGQIQPIVINKDRRLIAGGRRLAAMKLLGRETIAATVFDLDDIDALQVERDENDQRKSPTTSEKVALAEAIAERLRGRQGRPEKGGNISTINDDAGKTRDIAASKAGLGSGKTLEAAQAVIANGIPELVQAMDDGKVTVHGAKDIATMSKDEQASIDYNDAKDLKNARNRASKRLSDKKIRDNKETIEAPPPAPKADEQRLYSPGSSLSAFVLAARAVHAIQQISRNDPNAIAAIDDIQATLSKQLFEITKEPK